MKAWSWVPGALAWVIVAPAVDAAPGDVPQSPTEQARAAFEAGDYAGSLRKISAALSSKGVRRDSPERYDLLMLRGESLLRLKQRQPAAAAFEAAASVMKGRADVDRAASATALATLVSASPNLTYKPGGDPGATGIDIVDPASRRAAMAALFHDLSARTDPAIDNALKDTSLLPTHALLPDAWRLYAVELAATGDTASTASRLQDLGEHARTLVAAELERITSRLEQLNDLADEPTWVTAVMSYRGLTTGERNELHELAEYLVKIQQTVENGRRISRLLGRTGENWDTLLADCATARDVAQRAYDRRY
jgi:hypothetical protein